MAGSLSGLYGGRGIALTHGEGAWVWGSDGRRYIDFFNGHGAALFGHANPVLTEALAEAARGVWSCGALGLTFNPKYRAPFTSLIPAAKHYAPEDIPAKISNETLAVFIEPVQGEGGVYPIPEEVRRAITESCHAHGVLLIADEVQSGLGRCGSFFASAERGLAPDIICLAKGLAGGMPAGAVVWRGELGDFPPHSHGSTYGGNELTARVSLAALKYIKENGLCAHAAKTGAFIREEISRRSIPLVGDVRGAGLLIGVETEIPSQDIVKALQENGLLSLAAGPRVVRFLPSFAVTEEIAREAADIFEKTMNDLDARRNEGVA